MRHEIATVPRPAPRDDVAVSPQDYFSPDYETARARFRAAAERAGARLDALPLHATSPRGEALSIDIASLGAREPRRVLLHACGIHGLEAFTGSAVQLAMLDEPPRVGADEALILVHVLNPFGMSWLRRANENNVDLNRNFLADGDNWTGAPALYRVLDPLLNPRSPPSRDAFGVRAAITSFRYGFHRVKDAIAQGQYEYPQGLFFGGNALQPGPCRYLDWLRQHLQSVEYVCAIDLHTGLGKFATDTVIPEMRVNVTPLETLAAALERPLVDVSGPSVAYEVRGSMGAALPRALSHARFDCVLQEIGTRGPLAVLHALREENRWHFFGDGSIVHPAKQRLRDALCPPDAEWRREAVRLGVKLARAAARWVHRKE